MCQDVFGHQFNRNYIEGKISETNNNYKGLKPNITRVVFANHGVDPWHPLGLLQSLNDETPAYFSRTSSHCADLGGMSYNEDLNRVVAKEMQWVQRWIR